MASIEGEQLHVFVGLETSDGARNRPISGSREALVSVIQKCLADLLPSPSGNLLDLAIQICDDSWGADVFADLVDRDIPNHAVLRFKVAQRVESGGLGAMACNRSLKCNFLYNYVM